MEQRTKIKFAWKPVNAIPLDGRVIWLQWYTETEQQVALKKFVQISADRGFYETYFGWQVIKRA